MQGASGKQQQAQAHFQQGQIAARRRVTPAAHYALYKVQPDHQADPAVGVHAVFQNASHGNAQRQHLQGQPGSAGAQRSNPEFPGQPQSDQAQQAASSQPAGETDCGLAGGNGVGRSGWGGGQHGGGIIAGCNGFTVSELGWPKWSTVPWRDAALTLRERFREDRLGLTASSLTFTTTIALVPLITVALAVLTAFPMFAKFQDVLQKWLIESLIPDNIARQVLGYLNQFSGKASKLGAFGLAALVTSALALVFTIDRTLNTIWRVRNTRPFGQRVLVYWSAMTLGPVLLGASLSMTSYALSASRGLVVALPGGVGFLLDVLQFLLVAGGMAAMFHFVPNTFVRWGHAWMGGLFVSAGLEVAKKLLALYLSKVPTYYSAFMVPLPQCRFCWCGFIWPG